MNGNRCIKSVSVVNFAREKMYSQGGIFSITSRILVVDLLSSRFLPWPSSAATAYFAELLNPETVTGLVVLHSERYFTGLSVASSF